MRLLQMLSIVSLLFFLVSPLELHATRYNKKDTLEVYTDRQARLKRPKEKGNRFHPFYWGQGKLHRFALKNINPQTKEPSTRLLNILTRLSRNPERVTMGDYLTLLYALKPQGEDRKFLHPHTMITYNITPNGYHQASLAFFIHTSPTLNPHAKSHLLDQLGGIEHLQKQGEYTRKIYGKSGNLLSIHRVTLK